MKESTLLPITSTTLLQGLPRRRIMNSSSRLSNFRRSAAGSSVVLVMSMMMMISCWHILVLLPTAVSARAILGVDLGSLYMKVALVQSGSPLEIVTNTHSKRKTEQMILFDRQQRFYGADALSLLARKSQKTPSAMSVLLGRDDQHPLVQILKERHYPVQPVYNETRAGIVLTVDGSTFTPEELVAMVLSHAVDISVAHATASGNTIVPPQDLVLTVPCHATVLERRALLDAAALVHLNVLALIEENTAAALNYAMDKTFDKDGKSDDQHVIFYNLGASSLQVSLVHFFSYDQPQKFGKSKRVPAFEVLAKAWDATLGGEAFDHVVVEHLANAFNANWRKERGGDNTFDVRNHPRAMTKLRIEANKIKHVLSANTYVPVYMESVHDDLSLKTELTRAELEEMSSDLLKRAVAPIDRVLDIANKTLDDVTGIELIGGGMRIPRVQTEISKKVGSKMELGMHINSDESMALGAAFAGANISTAFRVRHVGLTDINPFAIQVALNDLPVAETESGGGFFGGGKKKKVEKPAVAEGDDQDAWSKKATIFKSFGKLGVKKTIAFTHDKDVHCALDYEPSDLLPEGVQMALERYNVTGVAAFAAVMAEKGLGKPKVSLQFELSSSGITSLVKADAAVDEIYTVQEEVEVPDDEQDDETTNSTVSDAGDKTQETLKEEGNATETDGTNETKVQEPKKKKTKMIDKEKKRVHRKSLDISTYYVGRVQPHSPELLESSRSRLLELAQRDKERMMLEEARNKLESYIYKVKNALEEKVEELSKVSTEEQREECRKLAEQAEEWMYEDGHGADLETLEYKYTELSTPFEKILLRYDELKMLPDHLEKMRKYLGEIEALMTDWITSAPYITEPERQQVLDEVERVRGWLDQGEKDQAQLTPFDEPVFKSSDIPSMSYKVEEILTILGRKPKTYKAKVEFDRVKDIKKENTTKADNGNSTTGTDGNSTETSSNSSPTTEGAQEEEAAMATGGADDEGSKLSPNADDEL